MAAVTCASEHSPVTEAVASRASARTRSRSFLRVDRAQIHLQREEDTFALHVEIVYESECVSLSLACFLCVNFTSTFDALTDHARVRAFLVSCNFCRLISHICLE